MPKVSDQYIQDKKNNIMDCAMELMKEIPLYQITMRDIIKKVGCSQGFIYRYYQGVDEIYADLMNREIKDIDHAIRVDELLAKDASEREIIKELFDELGNYILTVQQRIGGKFYFELLVCYAFDDKKQKELLPTLLFKQNIIYFQTQTINYILKKTAEGILTPNIPIEVIASYAGATIDGINNHAALTGKDNVDAIREEVLTLYHILGEFVVGCLK